MFTLLLATVGLATFYGALWHNQPARGSRRQTRKEAHLQRKEKANNEQTSTINRSSTLHTPALLRPPERIHQLASAPYGALGAVEGMNRGEWHAAEEELKDRLEDERREHQQ